MLELSGMGGLLRGMGIMYWLLAFGSMALALRYGKRVWGKAIGVAIAVAVFGYLPGKEIVEQHRHNAYEKQAWAYFKKLCDEKSGEKIYKTYAGVKSVLIVKPLPPATDKDHFDQFWYGDPYSLPATSNRVTRAAGLLTLDSRSEGRIQKGLRFVEIKNASSDGVQYQKISSPPDQSDYLIENIQKPTSRFGISWEDISKPEDRRYWVAGSRLRVIDLVDNSIIAERIGYFIEAGFGSEGGGRRPWLTSRGPNTTCPPIHSDYADQQFISRLFSLSGEK